MYENMLSSMVRIRRDDMEAERKQELENHIADLEKQIIPSTRKAKMQRFFDEKLNYLTEKGKLSAAVAQVLSVIHHYRNLAYHQEKIRKETLRPVVLLLFEVVCDLLVVFRSGGMCWVGGEDYSWFEKRYGISAWEAMHEKGRSTIRDLLRDNLPLELSDLRVALLSHLEERLEDVMGALDFVAKNSDLGDNLDGALKRIQFWNSPSVQSSKSSLETFQKAFDRFVPQYTMKMLEEWHKNSQRLKLLNDKLAVFAEFARSEQFFEAIEEMVHEAAAELDAAIQAEVDRLRGK
jgi:hypothetical protein